MGIFRSPGKPLPTLTEYLHHLVRRDSGAFGGLAVAGAIGAMLLLIGIALDLDLIFIALLLGLSGLGLAYWWPGRTKRKSEPRDVLHQEAIALAKQMIASKRLHKDLDAASAQLLEESAKFWREIRAELDNPFWRNPGLPSHWKTVREQTSAAADGAMEEILVLLRSSFHPNYAQGGWENVVEDAIETFVTGPKLRKGDRMPPGFAEARQIAEKLKIASSQVRTASLEVSAEQGATPLLSSGAALDMAIGDMRSLQEAEQELRRNLNA